MFASCCLSLLRVVSLRILTWPASSLNPYCGLLYSHVEALGADVTPYSRHALLKGTYDIWHMHWPESALYRDDAVQAMTGVVKMLGITHMLRLRGAKAVWTVHNLQTHETLHPRLEPLFWKAFTRSIDGTISLSRAAQGVALRRFPALENRAVRVIPHGHYRRVYPNETDKEEARRQLDVPPTSRVITFFGAIRRYKNIPGLIRTFSQLSDPEVRLLIAGRPHERDVSQAVRDAARHDERVQLAIEEYVPEQDVQLYLNAADLVVLPYEAILNSGSALLALSFDRPVLVPHLGSLPELQEILGEDWVRTYEGGLTAEILREAVGWALCVPRDFQVPLDEFSWPVLAQQTLDFYRELQSG